MRRKVLLTSPFLVLAALPATVFGQQPAENAEKKQAEHVAATCPKLGVKSATPQFIREGSPVTFAAEIAGGDPNVSPTILWSLSAGMIKADQGRHIEVDSTGAGSTRNITANLWVGGYAPDCATSASASVRVVPPAALADEFGEIAADKEKERLDNAAFRAAELNDRLSVIVYAGRTSVRGYTYSALKRIGSELVKTGLRPDRVVTTDGGFREQPAVELWIVPDGAEQPKPTPTVDRREIVYPKPVPKTKKKP